MSEIIIPTHAVVDGDAFKYSAAHVGEKKSIIVTHRTEGWSEPFKTRTQFWGHHKKKAGGWLATRNADRTSPYLPEEFDIEDVSNPEPLSHVLNTVKLMVDRELAASGAESYEFYMGKGDSFRVGLSSLMEYKGNRPTTKPYHLDDVTEYLAKRYNAEFITDLEADDVVNIRCWKQPKHFALGEDKDYWGCPINFFDINRKERGIVNCDKLGHLFRDEKGKIRGEGRIHMYWQIISEDSVDNYKANCHSDVEWAAVSAFNVLHGLKTDKECLVAMVDVFKKLYPEPKWVSSWRGDTLRIDWLYVFQEMWNMAMMKRTETEQPVDVQSLLERMRIEF